MEYNIWVPMEKGGYGSTLSSPYLINHNEINKIWLKYNDIELFLGPT